MITAFEKFVQEHRPLLLDGAMGTLLQSRDYQLPAPQWSAAVLESAPEVIIGIHQEYLNAGAELITTVTFRTTGRVYGQIGRPERARELTALAVRCAREAIRDRECAFIAGSVAPLEDCYRPDLVPEDAALSREHAEQIDCLITAGVDCLLFETMNSIREAAVCAEIARERAVPFFVSFVCDSPTTVLSGESLKEALQTVIRYQPLAVVINCTHPDIITEALQRLRTFTEYRLGAYANVGESTPEQGGTIERIMTPDWYVQFVRQWMDLDLSLVGGCCGATPEHIRAIQQEIGSMRGD